MQELGNIMEALTGSLEEPSTLALLTRSIIGFLGGALVGLERERAEITYKKPSGRYAELPGFRSFSLTSLLGAFTGILLCMENPRLSLLGIVTAIGYLIMIVSYLLYRFFIVKSGSIHMQIALLATYFIGILAGLGYLVTSIALSILITLSLALKLPVEQAIKGLSYNELLAGLELGIIVFILGPIFYSLKDFKLFGISVWPIYIFFTVILFLSFTSYVLVKLKGSSSISYLAIFGSFVNSEATLVNILNVLRNTRNYTKQIINTLTIILISVMQIKSLLLVLLAAPFFLGLESAEYLLMWLIAGVLPALMLFTYTTTIKKMHSRVFDSQQEINIEIISPLSYNVAVRATLLYAVLLIASLILNKVLGEYGLMTLGFLGGLVNASASIFSILVSSQLYSQKLVAASILLAIGSASLNKLIYARTIKAEKEVLRCVDKWSLILAMPPFIVALILLIF